MTSDAWRDPDPAGSPVSQPSGAGSAGHALHALRGQAPVAGAAPDRIVASTEGSAGWGYGPRSSARAAASAHDVAKYILERTGPMTAMKLQKLVYYCQAWSLVWDERVLFPERIEAWANGPVLPALYRVHRGEFWVEGWPLGDVANIDDAGRETVDAVIRDYGGCSAQRLSDLTHAEPPWRDARVGLADGERGHREITLAALNEYFGSLPPSEPE